MPLENEIALRQANETKGGQSEKKEKKKRHADAQTDGGPEDGMGWDATRWRWRRRRNRDLKKTVPAGYGRMQRGEGEDTNLENHTYHKHS